MTARERRPLVGGNWKMNLLRADAEEYTRRLREGFGDAAAEVVIFPPHPLVPIVAAGLEGRTGRMGRTGPARGGEGRPHRRRLRSPAGRSPAAPGFWWVTASAVRITGRSDELVRDKAMAALPATVSSR